MGKRLRGLSPATVYTFHAKASNGIEASALVEIGTWRTNNDCDASRSGLAVALDYAYVRKAMLTGTTIGIDLLRPDGCLVLCERRLRSLAGGGRRARRQGHRYPATRQVSSSPTTCCVQSGLSCSA